MIDARQARPVIAAHQAARAIQGVDHLGRMLMRARHQHILAAQLQDALGALRQIGVVLVVLFILDQTECAKRILQLGCEYVLVTGTHEHTPKVINTLYGARGLVRSDNWPRLSGIYHGSGCTLASAIAALLANGLPMEEAVKEAQEYTWQTLQFGFRPGMGQHIPDRLFWARDEEDDEPSETKH